MPGRRLALSVFNRRDKFLLIVLLVLRAVMATTITRARAAMAIAEAADVDRKADVATATIKRTFIFGINENSRVGVSDSAIFFVV